MKLRTRKPPSAQADEPPAKPAKKKQKKAPKNKDEQVENLEADDEDTFPFFDSVENEDRKKDFVELHKMIRKFAPSLEPTTEFSHGLIGYGKYHYKYKSGREGDGVKISLANNKQNMALHCCGLLKDGRHVVESMNTKLGKCSAGKSCVRFKKLSDLDQSGLEELIRAMAECEILQ